MPPRKVIKRQLPPQEKSRFDVNFREPEDIMIKIEHLLEGECIFTRRKLLNLALSILGKLDPFVYELLDRLEMLRIAQNVSQCGFENIPSTRSQFSQE